MLNKLKIDIGLFDRELMMSDAYGHSIIVCNFITCQKLLGDSDLKDMYSYKGHSIYLDSNLLDDEYMIFPIINIEKMKDKLGWTKYKEAWRKDGE